MHVFRRWRASSGPSGWSRRWGGFPAFRDSFKQFPNVDLAGPGNPQGKQDVPPASNYRQHEQPRHALHRASSRRRRSTAWSLRLTLIPVSLSQLSRPAAQFSSRSPRVKLTVVDTYGYLDRHGLAADRSPCPAASTFVSITTRPSCSPKKLNSVAAGRHILDLGPLCHSQKWRARWLPCSFIATASARSPRIRLSCVVDPTGCGDTFQPVGMMGSIAADPSAQKDPG